MLRSVRLPGTAGLTSVLAAAPQRAHEEEPGDDPLLEDFKVLRRRIFHWHGARAGARADLPSLAPQTACLKKSGCADWSLVAPLEYLGPFLEVIRSPETSGPITGVALTSVCRMLDEFTLGARGGTPPARPARAPQRRPAGLHSRERAACAAAGERVERAWRPWAGAGAARGAGESGADLAEAMRLTAEAVTQCKFEATDPAADEVVLFKILQVHSAAPARARCGASAALATLGLLNGGSCQPCHVQVKTRTRTALALEAARSAAAAR